MDSQATTPTRSVVQKKPTQVKVITLGNRHVGKTSLIQRFANNKFMPYYKATIGVDFQRKDVQLCDGESMRISLFDVAGSESFRTLTRQYYQGAEGILFCFSFDDRQSFEKIEDWREQTDICDKNVVMILVGTKSDLERRVVSTEEAESFAREQSMMFFETSAKSNIGITEAFDYIAHEVYRRRNRLLEHKSTVRLSSRVSNQNNRRSCQCG
mmetsp:Transcript_23434/g.26586  ORF Transcript_23434/g.26586 Transcript_23434/m.26586 type:complete len:212 (+) Transcript_23434:817-1452(+)